MNNTARCKGCGAEITKKGDELCVVCEKLSDAKKAERRKRKLSK